MKRTVFNDLDKAFNAMEKDLEKNKNFLFNKDEREQIKDFDSTPISDLSEPIPRWKTESDKISSLLMK